MPFLPEDIDLAIALRFNVDPFDVNHTWPLELRDRALSWMNAEAKLEGMRAKRRDRDGRRRSHRRNGRRGRG